MAWPTRRLPDGRLVEMIGAPAAPPEPDDPPDRIAFNVIAVIDGSEIVVDRQLWDRETIERAGAS